MQKREMNNQKRINLAIKREISASCDIIKKERTKKVYFLF